MDKLDFFKAIYNGDPDLTCDTTKPTCYFSKPCDEVEDQQFPYGIEIKIDDGNEQRYLRPTGREQWADGKWLAINGFPELDEFCLFAALPNPIGDHWVIPMYKYFREEYLVFDMEPSAVEGMSHNRIGFARLNESATFL